MTVAGNHSAAERVVNALVPATAVRTQASATTLATTAKTGSAASTGSSITSTDFLTLLVSELKNQDPTQPTDPNAYVQQLVGVNSLQQLISINQGLSSLENGSTAATAASGVQQVS